MPVTRRKAADNVVPPDADPVVMGHPDLGYRPADMNARWTIAVAGLDGGTFDVGLYLPGDPINHREHVNGATAADTVIVDGPAVDAFRVGFDDLGEDAAPVVTVTMQARG